MKYRRIMEVLAGVLAAATLLSFSAACSVAWAQQAPKTPVGAPVQPLAPIPQINDGNTPEGAIGDSTRQRDAQLAASAQARPDTHLLSGMETLGLGSVHRLTRTFDPAVQISEFGQTGIVPGATVSVSSLGGSIDIGEHRRRYDLTVAYRGAETIYRPYYYPGIHNTPYHDGGISAQIFLGRWSLQLRDDVLYSWGPSFGGLFAGGPAQPDQNNSLASIQPSLVSGGTIQTALARQLSNTTLAEVDYARSRRTTWTLLGSYGLLRFLDPGYINSQTATFRVGYNYALSSKNNIALSYDRNRITFLQNSGRLETDLVQLGFGRKITGRLAFEVTAGPQLLHINYFGSSNPNRLSWSASSSLTYAKARTSYSLSYFRGISAGSGVFFGNKVQTVTAGASRELTKFWSAAVNGGYAVNDALGSAGILATQFNDWFAGANLNRAIGRQFHLGLSYGFQQQTSGGGVCPVLTCGLARPFAQYGATLQWHPLLVRDR